MAKKIFTYYSPGRTLIISIFLTIMLGTLLLMLPIAQQKPISFIDACFTATSATCVTGLFTIPLDHFTSFGISIILLLIQIGGIGIITMSLFFMSLFMKFGISTQVIASHILELDSWRNIKKLLIFIISLTCIAELIGALCIITTITTSLPGSISFKEAFFISLFHAISSFCNAGIFYSPAILLADEIRSFILIITTLLMFIGGFGFITWLEIIRYIKNKIQKKWSHHFSLQTRIIIYGSLSVLAISALLFWLLEKNHLLAHLTDSEKILQVIFYAVSFKGTGFLLVPTSSLKLPTLFLIMILGFIGASPESTGSGIKITTLSIIFASIRSVFLGKTSVNIRGRQIALDQILKAIAIIILSLCWISLTLFCLTITEHNQSFLALFCEAFAAFTNFGIATGISPSLSLIGKCLIIISMFVGRIGSVSFILALRFKKIGNNNIFSYPEERIMLG